MEIPYISALIGLVYQDGGRLCYIAAGITVGLLRQALFSMHQNKITFGRHCLEF